MLNKWSVSWANLNTKITVSKRELVLGTACGVMAGMLFGVFFSPKKEIVIGSNNGNNNGCNNTDSGNASTQKAPSLPGKHCDKH